MDHYYYSPKTRFSSSDRRKKCFRNFRKNCGKLRICKKKCLFSTTRDLQAQKELESDQNVKTREMACSCVKYDRLRQNYFFKKNKRQNVFFVTCPKNRVKFEGGTYSNKKRVTSVLFPNQKRVTSVAIFFFKWETLYDYNFLLGSDHTFIAQIFCSTFFVKVWPYLGL